MKGMFVSYSGLKKGTNVMILCLGSILTLLMSPFLFTSTSFPEQSIPPLSMLVSPTGAEIVLVPSTGV